jgi:hypothetical protein
MAHAPNGKLSGISIGLFKGEQRSPFAFESVDPALSWFRLENIRHDRNQSVAILRSEGIGLVFGVLAKFRPAHGFHDFTKLGEQLGSAEELAKRSHLDIIARPDRQEAVLSGEHLIGNHAL